MAKHLWCALLGGIGAVGMTLLAGAAAIASGTALYLYLCGAFLVGFPLGWWASVKEIL